MTTSLKVLIAVRKVLTDASVCDGRVYEHPKSTVGFPYVRLQLSDSQPDPVQGSGGGSDDGTSDSLTLQVFSRVPNVDEAAGIAATIKGLLNETALSVVGCSSALSWVRRERHFVEPDGLTRQWVIELDVMRRL